MHTFYDYLPSQNAWKVRQLLKHLALPVHTEYVSIFEGEGRSEAYRAINPTGAVPALRLADGRVLAESNAILFYLAQGSRYWPEDAYTQAKVLQWLNFEADYVQNGLASLRYWTQTGKLAARPAELVAMRRAAAAKNLDCLERALSTTPFLAGASYTIADIALYAYIHLAEEAGLCLADYPAVAAWIGRVRAQDGHLAEHYGYAVDPHSFAELA